MLRFLNKGSMTKAKATGRNWPLPPGAGVVAAAPMSSTAATGDDSLRALSGVLGTSDRANYGGVNIGINHHHKTRNSGRVSVTNLNQTRNRHMSTKSSAKGTEDFFHYGKKKQTAVSLKALMETGIGKRYVVVWGVRVCLSFVHVYVHLFVCVSHAFSHSH